MDEIETWQTHEERSPLLLNKPKESYSKGNEPHQKTSDQLAEAVRISFSYHTLATE